MIQLKVPDWWDSIRAILSFILTIASCYAVIWGKDISPERLNLLFNLTTLADTFYFVLKKRPEENGGAK